MPYHGLLDWRLGLAYLNMLQDPEYKCGLDGQFNTPELDGWLDSASELCKNFASQFNFVTKTWGGLPGFEVGSKRVIIVHPLWDKKNRSDIVAEAEANAGGHVAFLDTFNLLRRPGWCRMQLEKEVSP